jgi:hypothetical protein
LAAAAVVALWGFPQITSAQSWGVDYSGRLTEEGYHFRPSNLALPGALITLGAVASAVDGWHDFGLLQRSGIERTGAGKQWADRIAYYGSLPAFGLVFVEDLIGRERHHWKDQVMVTLLAEICNGSIVTLLKYRLNKQRPKGSGLSFPSGHTANAFLGAHIAFKEMKDSSPWLAGAGYLIATAVAASRVYDNWHWMADVVTGAGIGILSVELAYLIYFPRYTFPASKHKPLSEIFLFPALHQGRPALSLSYSF